MSNTAVYHFTFAGFVALVILALVAASSEKVGPIVVWMLGILIVLVLVANYRNTLGVFFTTQ